jgi:hypothetical protein
MADAVDDAFPARAVVLDVEQQRGQPVDGISEKAERCRIEYGNA